MRKLPFQRLVREIMQDFGPEKRITRDALIALQVGFQCYSFGVSCNHFQCGLFHGTSAPSLLAPILSAPSVMSTSAIHGTREHVNYLFLSSAGSV